MTEPKNPGERETTEPLPLPGLTPPAPGSSEMEKAARRTLSELKDLGLLTEANALTAQLILELAELIAQARAKRQASAAGIAAAQLLAAIDSLMPDKPEGGESDAFDQLAADLREAAKLGAAGRGS